MTWVDWVVIIVVLASTFGGLAQGIIGTVCSLCGLIFGLMIAAWNYGRLAGFLVPLLRIQAVADAIAFLLIAILIMAIANVVGTVISKTVRKLGLGCLDSLAGAVFGFIQGIVLVAIAILVVVAFFPQAQWLADARIPRQFFGALHWSTEVTPGDLAARLRHGLEEMEQKTPEWMHPETP